MIAKTKYRLQSWSEEQCGRIESIFRYRKSKLTSLLVLFSLLVITNWGCQLLGIERPCSGSDDCDPGLSCEMGGCKPVEPVEPVEPVDECVLDVPPPDCRGPIKFKDQFLEKAIREEAGVLSDRDIYYRDVAHLQYLSATREYVTSDDVIEDLSGLQCLTCLKWLEMENNRIKDIHPIESLERLQYLSLRRNEIEDIVPLRKLTALEMLILSENEISDISPLENLKGLWILDLFNNPIDDICSIVDIAIADEPSIVSRPANRHYGLIQFSVNFKNGFDDNDTEFDCDDRIECDGVRECDDISIRACLSKLADEIYEERRVILGHDCTSSS